MSKKFCTGIVCAVPGEYHRAREILEMKETASSWGARFSYKERKGERWELLMTGPGKRIPSEWRNREWNLLIDTGSCGALNTFLPLYQGQLSFSSRLGEKIFPSLLDESGRELLKGAFPNYDEGEILTVTEPVLSTKDRESHFLQWVSPVCSMESAYHFQDASALGIPVFSLRTITDRDNIISFSDFKSAIKTAMTALYSDLREFLIKNDKELLMIAR